MAETLGHHVRPRDRIKALRNPEEPTLDDDGDGDGNSVLVEPPVDDYGRRFEKSLYDLIKGLRKNKGNEKEYIQNSLKECRAEVKSQDLG